jgi:hypothetical protein
LVWLTCVLGGFVLCGFLVLRGVAAAQTSAQVRQAGAVQTSDEVLEAPRQFLHQPVALEGQVTRVLSPRVLALRSRATRRGLLIVLSDEAAQHASILREGQTVTILGIVRPLNRQELAALERQYQLGVGASVLLAGHASHPYILAYEVRPRAGPD